MDAKKIGEFLKAMRKSKGMTQADVADELYLSAKTISRWESGVGIPDINIITSVANLYGVTVDEILNGKKTKENENFETNTKKIIKIEQNSIKLLSNSIIKKFDVFFYLSLGIFPLFMLIETIVNLFIKKWYIIFILCIGFIFSLVILIIGNFQIKDRINDASDEKNINEVKAIVKEKINKRNHLYADIIFFYIFFQIILFSIEALVEYFIYDEKSLLFISGIAFTVELVFLLLYLFFRNIKKIFRQFLKK